MIQKDLNEGSSKQHDHDLVWTRNYKELTGTVNNHAAAESKADVGYNIVDGILDGIVDGIIPHKFICTIENGLLCDDNVRPTQNEILIDFNSIHLNRDDNNFSIFSPSTPAALQSIPFVANQYNPNSSSHSIAAILNDKIPNPKPVTPKVKKTRSMPGVFRRRANSDASQIFPFQEQSSFLLDAIHRTAELVNQTSTILNENLIIINNRVNLLNQKVDSLVKIGKLQHALNHVSGELLSDILF